MVMGSSSIHVWVTILTAVLAVTAMLNVTVKLMLMRLCNHAAMLKWGGRSGRFFIDPSGTVGTAMSSVVV